MSISPRHTSLTPSRRSVMLLAAGTATAGLVGAPMRAEALSAADAPYPSPRPGVLFEADFRRRGLAQFAEFHPRSLTSAVDLGTVGDPLDAGRTVAWFDSHRKLNVGTSYPRSIASTPKFLERDDQMWASTEVMVASKGTAMSEHNDWLQLLAGAYGAPYGGPAPVGVSIVRQRSGRIHVNACSDYDLLRDEIEFPMDEWVKIAVNFKLDYDGWLELYLDRGDGWENIPLGGRRRHPLDTLRRGCNDGGANDARVGVYGSKPSRAYFASFVVGNSKRAVTGMQ